MKTLPILLALMCQSLFCSSAPLKLYASSNNPKLNIARKSTKVTKQRHFVIVVASYKNDEYF